MQNEEILVKLAKRTIKYFQNDIDLPIDNSYEILEVKRIDYFDITSLISLSMDMSGTVGMSVSNKLAYKMLEKFVSENILEEDIPELASGNIAETLNITLGNILKELTVIKAGGSVNISTPYTMHNSVSITKKKDGIMYLCKLKSNDEVILLSYFI